MAANMNARLVLAALVAVVLVAVIGAVAQATPARAEEDELAGEWYFAFDLAPPYEHLFPPTVCMASMVEDGAEGLSVVGTCNHLERLTGRALIDKESGAVSLNLSYSTVNHDVTGALDLEGRPCLHAEQPGMNATFTIDACKGNEGRGLVRCPSLRLGAVPSAPVGSKDARMILLAGAGLPLGQEAGCWFRGDVNVDGLIDSRDAVLILQFEAGLIAHFPP